MADWKRLLFIGVGWGLGTAVGLAILVGGFHWYKSRPKSPKPWNSKAIEAQYVDTWFLENEKERKLAAVFTFDLRNNTEVDYTLEEKPSARIVVMQKLKSSDTLVSGMGLYWLLENGSGTKPDEFIPVATPILIPSGQAVRVGFWSGYDVVDIAAALGKDEKMQLSDQNQQKRIFKNSLKDTDSYVLLDKVNRYRIELPLQDALR